MYLWRLHMLAPLIYSKAYIRSGDSQVDQLTHHPPIQLSILKQLVLFNLPLTQDLIPFLKRCLSYLPSKHISLLQHIHSILPLRHKQTLLRSAYLNPQKILHLSQVFNIKHKLEKLFGGFNPSLITPCDNQIIHIHQNHYDP
ncbi:hypothetical protein YC2023_094340 [Brassica napus]